MRHRYNVAGLPALAVAVIRDALDDLGPEPAGRRGRPAPTLRLAVKLPAKRKAVLTWLVEDGHEVKAWCDASGLMSEQMVYAEARERLAFWGLYDPRLDGCCVRLIDLAA